MTELLQNIGDWINSNPFLANIGITSFVVYSIFKDIAVAVIKHGAKKVKDAVEDTGVKKEDIENVMVELKQLKKAIGTAYANSKLDASVKIRVQDELDGKETKVVEVVKVETPVVETTQTVAQKLESQLK
jgi:hypothetical protein